MRIAITVLLVVSTVTLVQNRIRINELRAQKETLEAAVEELNERIDEIKYDLSHELTDEYIERIARDRLNMHLPGEIVFYYGN